MHDAHCTCPRVLFRLAFSSNIKTAPSFPLTGYNIKNTENTIRIIKIIISGLAKCHSDAEFWMLF